jgi:hypothetical protein
MSRYEPGGGGGDHFRLDVDPVELAAAETQFANAREYLTGRAKVATFGGDHAGWTGAAAKACRRETENISTSLRSTAPKFEAAAEAVKTFRMAVLTAQDELAKLNADWAQSENDYQTARDKAQKAMEAPDPLPTGEPTFLHELQRINRQAGLTGEYDHIVTRLGNAARACGAALAGSAPISLNADQWRKVKGGNVDITVLASVHSQAFGGQDSFVSQPYPPHAPPSNGSPGDSAAWWKSLSPNQRQQVVTEHPEWIGNRDGVPFTARDKANRALISVHRANLLAEKKRLEADLADNWHPDLFTSDDTALEQVKAKLASLDEVDKVLAKPGEHQLLLLNVGPERVEAALARGDVDTADNVAVLVPGLDTTVDDDLKGYDHQMELLQQRTERESKRAGANKSAAAVMWIGYQTPQSGWDYATPGRSITTDYLAQEGAAKLAPFLRGIDAARENDAHLTLLAHSYGSTTAGLALQKGTGVDDAVFFGSPGLGTNNVKDLKLADGHAHYIEAKWDGVGDLGQFGIDPSHMDGIEHNSASEATVVDPITGEPRHFEGVTGHSNYLDDFSTSQYNMAVVVAGLPDRQVNDRGEGVGDVLSWPVPWTY